MKAYRILAGLLCLLLCIAALPACRENIPSSEGEGYTFTDDLGRRVTVSSAERVAALLGSYADLWLLAGGSLCAAADDAWEDFALPLDESVINLGATKEPNLELLLASRPDLVLASTNTAAHLEWRPILESAGITVAYFDVCHFSDYLRMLKICTDLTGREELYALHGEAQAERIARVVSHFSKGPIQSVLFLRASATSIRAKGNEGTILGEMLQELSCRNLADENGALTEYLSLESILLANPDRIFIVQSGDDTEGTLKNIEKMLEENPLWQELDAVKAGRVYLLDKRLYNLKPNARWAEAYEELERILYGEE